MSSDYTARCQGEKTGGSMREESDMACAAWFACIKTKLCACTHTSLQLNTPLVPPIPPVLLTWTGHLGNPVS